MGDSQRAFPKAASACLAHFPSLLLDAVSCIWFVWFLSPLSPPSILDPGMKHVNGTLLLPLLSRCQQVLEDAGLNISGGHVNGTASSASNATASSSRESHANASVYIVVVMLFYSLLAMALFKCLGSDEDKEEYEEAASAVQPSTQKFNTGCMEEKFYFEEESSL